MKRTRHSAELVVAKLREADATLAASNTVRRSPGLSAVRVPRPVPHDDNRVGKNSRSISNACNRSNSSSDKDLMSKPCIPEVVCRSH